MSAPALDSRTTTASCRIRAARVRFCDREDAEMFIEWLRVRSEAAGTGITFPLFVCTAADAYSVSSALTYAVFGECSIDELPDEAACAVETLTLPAVFGPFPSSNEWEVLFAISLRRVTT